MKVWLDDTRRAPKGWVLVQTPWDFRELLNRFSKQITHVSFDHDLGSGCETGYDLAKDIEESVLGADKTIGWPINHDIIFYVHSANPVGAKRIQAALNNALKFMGRKPHTIMVDALEMYDGAY